MSQSRKNFIPRNEGFTCEVCRTPVGPAKSTFRNHCPNCLTSKHVDDALPGDRASACGGLMKLIRVEGTDPDCLDLIHQCEICGKISRNRTAFDDNRTLLLSDKPYFESEDSSRG